MSDDTISDTKSLSDEYDELVLSPPSESEPLSSVGCDSTCCKLRSAPFSELPSSQTGKRIGVSVFANHLGLSPICVGSSTPVCTRRNATFVGCSDHSARNSTAWVRANLLRKLDARGLDRKKLLI